MVMIASFDGERRRISAMERILALATGIATATILLGCSTTIERVSDSDAVKALGFLQAKTVTREEVQGRTGAPVATYENGRIATYRMSRKDGQFARGTEDAAFTLVVVYRPDDVVERWSLVHRRHEE